MEEKIEKKMEKNSEIRHGNSEEPGSEDSTVRFLNSLQELRELRSQIHYAADYCELAFFNAPVPDKSLVMDNTKEYICRAVVTVVDHLGNVSSNLNTNLEKSDRVSETQLRIHCLKQKLQSCEVYNRNFTLTKMRWGPDLPRFYPRYISSSNSNVKESSGGSREARDSARESGASEQELKEEEETPLFMFTTPNIRSIRGIPSCLASAVPTRDGLLVPSILRNSSFHFQNTKKRTGWRSWHRRSMQDKEILSFLRRSKKEPSRLFKASLVPSFPS